MNRRHLPRIASRAMLSVLLLVSAVLSADDALKTVASVDLSRYAGRWYEIAKIPNRFQRDCVADTWAEYRRRDDGRIAVLNRCREADGSIEKAHGVARAVPGSHDSKLEVSFVRFLGRQWFWADDWIVALGKDYDWVIVGEPGRDYGWILARSPTIAPALRERLDRLLREAGYDPARFEDTLQRAGEDQPASSSASSS